MLSLKEKKKITQKADWLTTDTAVYRRGRGLSFQQMADVVLLKDVGVFY